jgi:hypothetical protein
MKTTFLAILAMSLTVHCGTDSSIQPVSQSRSWFEGAVYAGQLHTIAEDTSGAVRYRIFEKGATGFVRVQALRETAAERAAAFCAREGLGMKVLTEETSPPAVLPGNFPRIELVFACVPKGVPAMGTTTAVHDDTYVRLTNLKKLLDNGVLTQEEFAREKAKILNEPAPQKPPS